MSGAYEITGTPGAVIGRLDSTIGSPAAMGSEAIESLLSQVVEVPAMVPLLPGAPDPTPAANNGLCPKCTKNHSAEAVPAMPAALKVGEATPEAKLKDLNGEDIELKDFLG